jgi:UDP-N-acetylmuramoyl-L-alanyl-D-glutamate--2,6-diaminopimelate ligase
MIAINENAHVFLSPWLTELPVGLKDIKINNLCFDSREVTQGDAFVVMPSVAGKQVEYVKAAQKNGAALLIASEDYSSLFNGSCLQVVNLLDVMGSLVHSTLGSACDNMSVIGITGTNGKSSISFYLAQLLNELKKPCAVMGTLGYGDTQLLTETGMTTLPLEQLHLALQELSGQYQSIAMEVSSHGLEQGRLAGVKFKGAIYSNLSRDHLDYHGDMASYGAAKAKLFNWPELEFAVLNRDDEHADAMMASSNCEQVIYYGQSERSHLRFTFQKIHNKGMVLEFSWQGQLLSVELPLYGQFNAYNVAAAVATALQLGFDFKQTIMALHALEPVPGRMQQVNSKAGEPLVLVDYAHTPDALKQALQAVKEHCPGKIYLVVGCGGDRDVGKRPLMGQIAQQYADKVIYTSDNPRSESPSVICAHMTEQLPKGTYQLELDRKVAIEAAIMAAGPTDLVVIAGKGHENYQEVNGRRSYFSDEAVAQAALIFRSKA